jgi:putative ABC transport system ATP-binding protein
MTAVPPQPPVASQAPLIDLRNVSRVYRLGDVSVTAVTNVDLKIHRGEFVAVVGPSGSGKTTIMNIIGCLDQPTSGSYTLMGASVDKLGNNELAQLRAYVIGFVFQNYNLLSRMSALENVAVPLLYQRVSGRERAARAKEALEALGMGDRLNHQPSQLSGGEQQRVAIARALVTRPELVLADEPTGNMDSAGGAEVIGRLRQLNRDGRTIVLVTHNPELAREAGRQVNMRDGRLVA